MTFVAISVETIRRQNGILVRERIQYQLQGRQFVRMVWEARPWDESLECVSVNHSVSIRDFCQALAAFATSRAMVGIHDGTAPLLAVLVRAVVDSSDTVALAQLEDLLIEGTVE